MTCREFKHSAEALTLWELSRAQNEDELISNHAQQCESCGSWLSEQRSLAASLGTLQAQTAGLEAGANVERAVLQAFRQHSAQSGALSKASSTAGTTAAPDAGPHGIRDGTSAMRPVAAPVSAPYALRLSRWFEVGAYVAIAAAVIVGMFLGVRLLEHRSKPVPVQAQAAPANTQPVVQKPVVAAQAESPKLSPVSTSKHTPSARAAAVQPVYSEKKTTAVVQTAATDEAQSDSDAGYIALMFCDPLSCSADSQVVRMELPAPASAAGQNFRPQAADVVVGYDGVVRAVRMVN